MLLSFESTCQQLLHHQFAKVMDYAERAQTRVLQEERKMRSGRVRTAVAVPLVAGLLAGCGGSEKQPEPPPKGKVVRGETETGMKLTVDTFLPPDDDPLLAKLDAYRRRATTRRSTITASRPTTRPVR